MKAGPNRGSAFSLYNISILGAGMPDKKILGGYFFGKRNMQIELPGDPVYVTHVPQYAKASTDELYEPGAINPASEGYKRSHRSTSHHK
jgi:hypothetical protein